MCIGSIPRRSSLNYSDLLIHSGQEKSPDETYLTLQQQEQQQEQQQHEHILLYQAAKVFPYPESNVPSKSFFPHIVTPSYVDHLHENTSEETDQKQRKHLGGVILPFPIRLHRMLEAMEKNGNASVVSWQPHGRAFVVHKPKEFVDIYISVYFNQSKLGSFQRQLNLYGFTRFTSGKDKGGYYHELFLRGMPFLCERMIRRKIKGTRVRRGGNPDTEPDFYKMEPVTQSLISSQKQALEQEDMTDKDYLEEEEETHEQIHAGNLDEVEFEGKLFHYLDSSSIGRCVSFESLVDLYAC